MWWTIRIPAGKIEPGEVVEAIMHCAPYTGFPRVLNAIFVAKRVFEERNLQI